MRATEEGFILWVKCHSYAVTNPTRLHHKFSKLIPFTSENFVFPVLKKKKKSLLGRRALSLCPLLMPA